MIGKAQKGKKERSNFLHLSVFEKPKYPSPRGEGSVVHRTVNDQGDRVEPPSPSVRERGQGVWKQKSFGIRRFFPAVRRHTFLNIGETFVFIADKENNT